MSFSHTKSMYNFAFIGKYETFNVINGQINIAMKIKNYC